VEQTQAFIRLVYQQRQQQLMLQQQHQHSFRKEQLHLAEIHERVSNFSHTSVKPQQQQELQQQSQQKDAKSTKRTISSDNPGDESACAGWSVEQVCHFVASVELCKPYVEVSCELLKKQKTCMN
jgi:hypothetical protein